MKNKKLLILLTAGLLITGCVKKEETPVKSEEPAIEEKVEEEETKKISAEDYNFYIDKDGKVISKDEIGDKLIVNWYSEPLCSHCIELENQVKDHMSEILGDEAVVKYNFVSFLGGDYSDEAAGYLISVANNDPDVADSFIKKVMSKEFASVASTKGSIEERKDSFKKAYEEVGGTKWEEVDKNRQAYSSIAIRETKVFTENSELAKIAGAENVFTPFVYVEGEEELLPTFEDEGVVEALRNKIVEIKEQRTENK